MASHTARNLEALSINPPPLDSDIANAAQAIRSPGATPSQSGDQETDVIPELSEGESVLTDTPGSRYYLPYVAVKAAVDQKGLDIKAIDVSRVTNFADIFVIISGTSERHVESLSDKIRTAMGKEGECVSGSVGYESSSWVILDYGNLIVHIFYEPTRQHYNFDELWKKGKVLQPTPALDREMRMLRTGMFR